MDERAAAAGEAPWDATLANTSRIARRELGALTAAHVVWWVLGAFLCQALCMGLMGLDDVLVARGGWSALFLVLLAPAVTMRLIARERMEGTLELLATLPVRERELVIGKFVAAFVLVAGAQSLVGLSLVSVGGAAPGLGTGSAAFWAFC